MPDGSVIDHQLCLRATRTQEVSLVGQAMREVLLAHQELEKNLVNYLGDAEVAEDAMAPIGDSIHETWERIDAAMEKHSRTRRA